MNVARDERIERWLKTSAGLVKRGPDIEMTPAGRCVNLELASGQGDG